MPKVQKQHLHFTRAERRERKDALKVAKELHPEMGRQRLLRGDVLVAGVGTVGGVISARYGIDLGTLAGMAGAAYGGALALVHELLPSRRFEPSSLDTVRKQFDRATDDGKAILLAMVQRSVADRQTPLPTDAQVTLSSMMAEVAKLPTETRERGARIGAVYGAFYTDDISEARAREVVDKFRALNPAEQQEVRPLLFKELYSLQQKKAVPPTPTAILFAALTPPDVAELQLENLLKQVEWSASPSSTGGATLVAEEAERIVSALQSLPEAERGAAVGMLRGLLFPDGEPSRRMDPTATRQLRAALGV